MARSNPAKLSARPRSPALEFMYRAPERSDLIQPALEFMYRAPERSDLIQLIDKDNPQHRLLDEILRLTFFEFDVLPPSEGDGDVSPEDESRRVTDAGVKECGDGAVLVTECDEVMLVTGGKEEVPRTGGGGEESDICLVFNRLNSRLDEMTHATKQMHLELVILGRDFQTTDRMTTRLLQETRRCLADIRAVRFLDDLLYMLRDQLEYITLRSWPFLAANLHDYWCDAEELNLVV